MIKEILFIIGLWFSNPVVPDFGIQFAVALIIGVILPKPVISPINGALLRIKPIRWFEEKLKNRERLRTIVPRIIAGYAFSYAIGGICLLLWWVL